MSQDEAIGLLDAVLEDIRQCVESLNAVAEFCGNAAGTLITQIGNDELATPYIQAGQALDGIVLGVARAFHDSVEEAKQVLESNR
jgi:hypothetical protein